MPPALPQIAAPALLAGFWNSIVIRNDPNDDFSLNV
ncbi:hypothetical protein SLEP1_g44795 [Rubroshorea leprosula]|uniref:Uncharacterized protein n=1 Tax=Rubroshorea leprosula TaxID=152421 RepID=A0AAV5LH61_9ROSI|nr:hypothetical protein SLEP1_g44795 [Rubroshorea leprosula]